LSASVVFPDASAPKISVIRPGLLGDFSAEKITIGKDIEPICSLLEAAPGRRRAAILASGDPCFFGIGPILAQRLGTARVRIHPQPSSVAHAFSRLGVAWQDATVLSVHGRPIADAVPAALPAHKVAFLTDPEHTPGEVARALLAAGMADCDAFVCERLGGPLERVEQMRLSELPERRFDPLNVLILLRDPRSVTVPALARPDSAYEQVRGQITKAEVRAITVARLEPWACSVLWDVGAGSGSVAIEAAGMMPRGTVYAVERDPEQVAALRANLHRFGAANLCVVEGQAPEALAALPRPDAVFLGGTGSRLGQILAVAAERIAPNGRLVANFAILEHFSAWQEFASNLGWDSEVSQISVARAEPLGDGTRLAPLGPAFVCRLTRPGGL
jgi:precorrin-6B C5,15-methyltransferase / cobalt-precorrin-6B C5,C15-methyltransferase